MGTNVFLNTASSDPRIENWVHKANTNNGKYAVMLKNGYHWGGRHTIHPASVKELKEMMKDVRVRNLIVNGWRTFNKRPQIIGNIKRISDEVRIKIEKQLKNYQKEPGTHSHEYEVVMEELKFFGFAPVWFWGCNGGKKRQRIICAAKAHFVGNDPYFMIAWEYCPREKN